MTPNCASRYTQRLTDCTLGESVVVQSLNRKGLVHTQLISHRLSSGGFLRKETTTAKQKPLCLNWYRFKRPSLVLFQRPLTRAWVWPGGCAVFAWWMEFFISSRSEMRKLGSRPTNPQSTSRSSLATIRLRASRHFCGAVILDLSPD